MKLALVSLALVASTASARAVEPRNVAIIVHQGVELLDFAGPAETFSAAGGGAFRVFTVGPTAERITSQGFVEVTPSYSIDNSPRVDILVIPGGRTRVLYDDPKMMAWIKERARTAELTMSVCNGALTLARTGLLDGLKATTHYGSVESLRKFSRVTVLPDERFVDNGRVMSTQGVSAGIDGALHVVEKLLGAEVAWADARYMMYRWEPAGMSKEAKAETRPWIEQDWRAVDAIYTRKLAANPKDTVAAGRAGIAAQELGDHARALPLLERALALGSHDPDVLDDLAEARVAVGRFDAAARAYEQELPLRYASAQAAVALAAARAWSRAGNKDAALEALGKAAAAGADCKPLVKDPDLANLRDDPRFAALTKSAR